MSGSVQVSIIIPTRDRAGMLGDTIASIAGDASLATRELVVVDNGSSDGTKGVVEAAAAVSSVAVTYTYEPEPGRSSALNHGLKVARGDIVVFTDDDVFVDPGWTDELAGAFEDPEVGAAGGRILPVWPRHRPPWLQGKTAERLAMPDLGLHARTLVWPDLPTGANTAVRKDALRDIDPPFEPTLGNRPGLALGWEEYHLFKMIAERWKVAYRPRAVVHHRIRVEAMTLAALRRAHVHLGFGLARMQRLEGEPAAHVARRLVHGVRSCRRAVATQRANRRRREFGPDEAWEELSALMWAGRDVGLLLGAWPACADRAAGWCGQLASHHTKVR